MIILYLKNGLETHEMQGLSVWDNPPPVKPWIGGIRNNLHLDFPEKKEFPLL